MSLWRRWCSRKKFRGGLTEDVTLFFRLSWEVDSVPEEDGKLREVSESLRMCR